MSQELTVFLNFTFTCQEIMTKVVDDFTYRVTNSARFLLNWREYAHALEEHGIQADLDKRSSLRRYAHPQINDNFYEKTIALQKEIRNILDEIIQTKKIKKKLWQKILNETEGLTVILTPPAAFQGDIDPDNIRLLNLHYIFDSEDYRNCVLGILRDLIVNKTIFNLAKAPDGSYYFKTDNSDLRVKSLEPWPQNQIPITNFANPSEFSNPLAAPLPETTPETAPATAPLPAPETTPGSASILAPPQPPPLLVPPSAPPSITDIASQAVPEDSADNLGTNFQKTPPESSELRQDPEFLEEPEEELLVLVDRVSEFETFNDINRPQDQPQTIVSEALQNEPRSQGDVQAEAQADTQAEASSLKAVTPEDLPPRSTPLPNEEVNAAEVSPAEGEVVTFALFFENGKGSESIKENISPKTQDLVSQPDHLTTTPLESLAPAESPDKLGSKVLSGESEKEGEESSLPYLGENIQPQEEIEPYSNYQSAESLEAETLSQPLKGLQAVTQREISLEEELAVDLLEDEEEILVDLTEQDPLRELMLGENPPEDIAPDNLPIEELILVEPVRGPLEEEIFGERSPLVASASASAPSEESEDYQQTTSQRAPKAPIIPFPAAPPALEEQLAKNSDPQFRDNCLGRETVFLPANFLPVEYLLATLDSRDSDGD